MLHEYFAEVSVYSASELSQSLIIHHWQCYLANMFQTYQTLRTEVHSLTQVSWEAFCHDLVWSILARIFVFLFCIHALNSMWTKKSLFIFCIFNRHLQVSGQNDLVLRTKHTFFRLDKTHSSIWTKEDIPCHYDTSITSLRMWGSFDNVKCCCFVCFYA